MEPTDRAFVLFVDWRPDGVDEPCEGRIEHVASGRSQPFASREDIWAFIRETLEAEAEAEKP